MDAPIDAVDDGADAVAELIGKALVIEPPHNRSVEFVAMEVDGVRATRLPAVGQRAVMALTMSPHSPSARVVGSSASESVYTSRLGLLGGPIALQGLQQPGVRSKSLRTWPASDCRSSVRAGTSASMARSMRVKRSAEIHGDQVLRLQPHPVGNVVLGDDEVLARIIATADDHMAVGMTGVEVIDRNPVQLRPEVLPHLPHYIPREGPQIGKLVGVFPSDDEAELMAVLPPAFDECLPSASSMPAL